jgi:hypothetical protein
MAAVAMEMATAAETLAVPTLATEAVVVGIVEAETALAAVITVERTATVAMEAADDRQQST